MKRTRELRELPGILSSAVPPVFKYYGDEYLWLPELSYLIFQHLGDSPTAVSLALTCRRELAIFRRIDRRPGLLLTAMASRAFLFGDIHLWSYATLEKRRHAEEGETCQCSLDEQAQLLGLLLPGAQINMKALVRVHSDNFFLTINA